MRRNFTMMMLMQMEPGGGGGGNPGSEARVVAGAVALRQHAVRPLLRVGHVLVKLKRGLGDGFELCGVEDAGLAAADVAPWLRTNIGDADAVARRRQGGLHVAGTGVKQVVVRKRSADLEGVLDLPTVPAADLIVRLPEVLFGPLKDAAAVDSDTALAVYLIGGFDFLSTLDVEQKDLSVLFTVERWIIEAHVDT